MSEAAINVAREGSRRRLLIVAGFLAILYGLAINNQWAIRPDSATYLGVGQSLAEGRGLTFNGSPAPALPPLVPLMVAACHLLVGGDYWLINLVMKVFAVGAAVMSYAVVRRLGEGLSDGVREDMAIGAALVAGTSARFFTDSTPVLTDIPFTFWFLVGLYGFVRGRTGHWGWTLAGSLVMVVAVATRYVGGVIFAGMVVAVLLDFRRPGHVKRSLAALAGFGVMAAGGVLLVTLARGPEAALNLGRALLGLCQEQWNSLVYGPKVADLGLAVAALPKVVCETVVDQEVKWFNVVPAGLVAVGLWASLRRKEKVAWVSVVALVGFLVLLGRAAVAPRYLLPVLPLLAYFLLRGVHETAAWVKARRRRAAVGRGEGAAEPTERRARVALTVTVAICLAVSLPKVFREIYWMRHPQFYEVYQKGRWQQWIEACAYLRARGRPGDVVGTTETSVVHYLSGLRFRSETFRVEPDNPDTWQYGFGNLTGFPPRVFAEATAKSEIRFLVIPTDLRRTSDSWSESAMRAIEAQGEFGSPPKRFGNVAVYERLAAREAAP